MQLVKTRVTSAGLEKLQAEQRQRWESYVTDPSPIQVIAQYVYTMETRNGSYDLLLAFVRMAPQVMMPVSCARCGTELPPHPLKWGLVLAELAERGLLPDKVEVLRCEHCPPTSKRQPGAKRPRYL